MDRRRFLRTGSLLSGAIAPGLLLPGVAAAAVISPAIPKFVTPLRRPGAQIPLAVPDAGAGLGGAVRYTLEMRQFDDQLLPAGFGPTTLWGYARPGQPGTHLGGVLAARRGTPVQVTFRNLLPPTHPLPVDRTVMGAETGPYNRTVVHLHGGKVPWVSDGGPQAWFSPDTANTSPEAVARQAALPSAPGSATYWYPNEQPARLMWFHDHAMGLTRLNAYAGLASAYVLTDAGEDALVAGAGLPGPFDERTHHLIFQDKVFQASGQLWYPDTYDTAMFALGPSTLPLPSPSAVPEFFGDTLLVNGTTYPYLTLPQGVHRLRMLNACSGRFLTPRLYYASNAAPTEANTQAPGPGFLQFGTEGGFLPAPVAVNAPSKLPLVLAPAERADLLLDLRNVPAGSTLILYNDAPAPFPGGSPMTDFYPGNPRNPRTPVGFGPDTRHLLQVRVTPAIGTPAGAPSLPADLRAYNDPLLVAQAPGVPNAIPAGARVRQLTLNESFDAWGRLLPLLGTATPNASGAVPPQYGLEFHAPATEVVNEGDVEVWEIFNLSADTHPIHFHLVNVQILNRQRLPLTAVGRGRTPVFDPRTVNYGARPVAPDANEMGWKETVRMNPGEVTRVIMRFDRATAGPLPFVLPTVAVDTATGPQQGHPFVWHCHMLEHEDRDMMRPLVVIPRP